MAASKKCKLEVFVDSDIETKEKPEHMFEPTGQWATAHTFATQLRFLQKVSCAALVLCAAFVFVLRSETCEFGPCCRVDEFGQLAHVVGLMSLASWPMLSC